MLRRHPPGRMVMRSIVALVACIVVASCAQPPAVTEPRPGGTASDDLIAVIERLRVQPEPQRIGYQRDNFDHWVDVDATGCATRSDVLVTQAIGPVDTAVDRPCSVQSGTWYSVYDGVVHTGSPADLDVDHVVALAEAWDSGAASLSAQRRREFANDPLNLLVVTRSTNQDKADSDLGQWRPQRRDAWCLVATMVTLTKLRYDLTVDAAERSALRSMAGGCTSESRADPGWYPLPGSEAFTSLVDAIERGS